MWKDSVNTLTLHCAQSLKVYQQLPTSEIAIINQELEIFVAQGILHLPRFYRVPLKIYALLLNLLCLLTYAKLGTKLNPQKRTRFVKRLSYLPFFGMMIKLIRSMVYLKVFDHIPYKTEGHA